MRRLTAVAVVILLLNIGMQTFAQPPDDLARYRLLYTCEIAFQSGFSEQMKACIMQANGEERFLIAPERNDFRRWYPGGWSPDGTQIVLSGIADDFSDAFLFDVEERQLQQITFTPDASEYDIEWLANGELVFSCGSEHELCSLNLDGSYWQYPGLNVNTVKSYFLSPSGEWELVRQADLSRSRVVRWTVVSSADADISPVELEAVTDMDPASLVPFWSPDETQIAFVAVYFDGSYPYPYRGLYLIDRDGTNMQLLYGKRYHNVEQVVWSPDGGQILFTLENDETECKELWLSDLGDGVIRRLDAGCLYVTLTAPKGFMNWSPDSRYIAYTCQYEAAEFDICVIEVDTGTQWQITNDHHSANPYWSPVIADSASE